MTELGWGISALCIVGLGLVAWDAWKGATR